MDVGGYRPNAGRVIYPPRSTLGPRRQYGCQLVAVHSGSVRVTVDGVEREIPTGHAGLLLPGTEEYFVFGYGPDTTQHSWLAVDPAHLDRDLLTALGTAPRRLPLTLPMTASIEAAREVAREDDPERDMVLIAVARAALLLYTVEARRASTQGVPEHAAVTQAVALARQRASEGITVMELARRVGVSPEHLVRLFRRDRDITPGAMLRAERMAQALRLLAQTGLTVTEIAAQTGFANSHHFARVMREVTGCTATEWRRRSWAGDCPGADPGA